MVHTVEQNSGQQMSSHDPEPAVTDSEQVPELSSKRYATQKGSL